MSDIPWMFIAAITVPKCMPDDAKDQQIENILFQKTRSMDIPAECLEKFETALARFTKETLAHFTQERPICAVQISIFCQQKIIEHAFRSPHAARVGETTTGLPQPCSEMNGGWGYYVIERGREAAGCSTLEACHIVELFVYREGK